jgi:hypothetical protein
MTAMFHGQAAVSQGFTRIGAFFAKFAVTPLLTGFHGRGRPQCTDLSTNRVDKRKLLGHP